MQIIIKVMEAVIDSRQLVYDGDDINSKIALSTNRFLVLNPKVGITQTNTEMDTD